MRRCIPFSNFSNSMINRPHFLSLNLLSTLPTFTIPTHSEVEESSDSEINTGPFPHGIIHDKHLLKKNPDGRLHVLELIDRGAMEPDARLYNKLLRRCTQLRLVKEGRMVHSHFLDSVFCKYVTIHNTLITMYAKCGWIVEARRLFDEMPNKDMVSWTALITGLSQNEREEESVGIFMLMLRDGLAPNEFTLGSVLKAAGAVGEREGRQIHGVCVKLGYDEDVFVGSALVDMYARCGEMKEAKTVFNGLSFKNEVSWNALISGHARKSEAEEAVSLFREMQRRNFEPTHFTYSSLFSACASIGALEQGKWVHSRMMKSGLTLSGFVGNTVLDMYGKSGSIEDAKKVFDRLLKQDIVSYNSLLTAYAQHGFGKRAVELFEELCRYGVKPNEITFLCILTACSHTGLLDQGLYYFDLMKTFDIEPEISHYVTIVDLLGRAGQLDHAQCFIKEMQIKPTAAVWKALLGACRMHKNVELGAYAAERVFELDPYDSGPHILLFNIYASSNRWKDAANVRKMMNDNGVKKEPACSWVDIENKVHIFVANDESHPQIKEICRTWETVSERIKGLGYIPDITQVLWFADEQERETRLQYHSEKLALAFALLKTPAGSIIRIKKNIRVCSDCHTAFKFVSQIMDREIILRDAHRFHHFRGGSCSCGDYW